jgi:hypothetical protein
VTRQDDPRALSVSPELPLIDEVLPSQLTARVSVGAPVQLATIERARVAVTEYEAEIDVGPCSQPCSTCWVVGVADTLGTVVVVCGLLAAAVEETAAVATSGEVLARGELAGAAGAVVLGLVVD